MVFVATPTCIAQGEVREGEPVALSPRLGKTIDGQEREHYRLFPNIESFEEAQIIRRGDEYELTISVRDRGSNEIKRQSVSEEVIDVTRRHVWLVEARDRWVAQTTSHDGAAPDEEWYRLGLVLDYASQARYGLAGLILQDLRTSLELDAFPIEPDPGQFLDLSALDADLSYLQENDRGLQTGTPLYDRRGRTDLLIYSGLWGIWAAIALPVSFESEDAQIYALSLMAVPATTVIGASAWSRNRDVGKGLAGFIALGGNLGLWQGIGWSAVRDLDGADAVAVGLGSSAVGIALGAWTGQAWNVSEGHGLLTSSSLWWGIWYGSVLGTILEDEASSDDLGLKTSLWTSAGTVALTGILTRGSPLREGQVRLINLGGILGTLFGFGFDVLIEVDDEETALGIAAAGTTAGLLVGYQLASRRAPSPEPARELGGLRVGPAVDRLHPGATMASASWTVGF
jgi:hypothetical protein